MELYILKSDKINSGSWINTPPFAVQIACIGWNLESDYIIWVIVHIISFRKENKSRSSWSLTSVYGYNCALSKEMRYETVRMGKGRSKPGREGEETWLDITGHKSLHWHSEVLTWEQTVNQKEKKKRLEQLFPRYEDAEGRNEADIIYQNKYACLL